MGSSGAVSMECHGGHHLEAFPVVAVDTTGAGDTFAAALAIAVASGLKSIDAVRFANAAGALSTAGRGAQTAMPTREAVERLLHEPQLTTRDDASH